MIQGSDYISDIMCYLILSIFFIKTKVIAWRKLVLEMVPVWIWRMITIVIAMMVSQGVTVNVSKICIL